MSTPAAAFWFVWSAVLVGWFSFVRVTLDVLWTLGVAFPAGYALGIVGGFLLLALTLFAIWLTPPLTLDGEAPRKSRLGRGLLTIYLIAVWLALLAGTAKLFFVGIILMLLPLALVGTKRSVNHLLRPPGSAAATDAVPTITTVCLERGLRALLLIGGAYSIAWRPGHQLRRDHRQRHDGDAADRAGSSMRIVIGLVAEFALAHAARLDRQQARRGQAPAAARQRGGAATRPRMRTLLPILRNVLLRHPGGDGGADGAGGAGRRRSAR